MTVYTVTQTGDSTLSATVTDTTTGVTIQGDDSLSVDLTVADDVSVLDINPVSATLPATTTNVAEGTNLYFTTARVIGAIQNSNINLDSPVVTGVITMPNALTEINASTVRIDATQLYVDAVIHAQMDGGTY